MPVRALVEAGGIFGLEANAMRVAVARLLGEGLVERDDRGLYRLGAGARTIGLRVASWREPAQRMRAWGGGWVGAWLGGARGALDRGTQRRGMRALRILGFLPLGPGLHVRPDNLADGVAGARALLGGLGLDPATPVLSLRDLDATTASRARALWDVAALHRGARDARAALEKSERRLARLDPPDAMRESFLVGGRAIRQINHDPLLPAEIDAGEEREALVAAMRRYDRLGRAAWADFLREHGVPHARGAAEIRMADAADTLSAASGPV
jgi:phenylacetic acid degradation operon negative regulatory protein